MVPTVRSISSQLARRRRFLLFVGLFLVLVIAGPIYSGSDTAGTARGRSLNQTVPTATATPTFVGGTVPIPTATPSAESNSRVIISEFMADNENILRDEDGDRSDWIEVYNTGDQAVDLEGWALSDRPDELNRWLFPAVTLPANGYLVIFASGKDRAVAGSELHVNFRLRREGEYLAIVRPDGEIVSSFSPLYPTQYPDISYGIDADGKQRYFSQPTPGADNNIPNNLGPRVASLDHVPAQPTEGETIVVTAKVAPGNAQIDTILFTYRIMFGPEVVVPMVLAGAATEGYSFYQAEIPASAYSAGNLVRYYVLAKGLDGNVTRWPSFPSPLNSPEYLGTMVADPSAESRLSILHWFSQDIEAAESDAGTRATIFYVDRLYDNIAVRPRGSSTRNLDKKSFKFVFNDGYHLTLPTSDVVDELNLNSSPRDSSYVRQILAWEAFRDAGSPYSIALPIHLRRNGQFYGLLTFIEQPEQSYFDRQDLDWEGALYKVEGNDLSTDTTFVDKKTRLEEDNSDLQALIDGLQLPAQAREAFLFDNVNIPAVLNYLAVNAIVEDWDHVVKNHYLYRDTLGTKEWMFIPWDKDLTFGGDGYDQNSHPLHGTQAYPVVYVEHDLRQWNRLIDSLLTTPRIKEMYLRRLRTLMDQLLQPSDVPASQRYLETRIDELVAYMAVDVARDIARWSLTASSADAVTALKVNHIDVRRRYLYDVHAAEGGLIPPAPTSLADIKFGEIVFPSSEASSDDAYFVLYNDSDTAVDLSGWTVSGDIDFTFQAGVVMAARSELYVAKDVPAFRIRAAGMPGRGSRFVQGGYKEDFAPVFGSLLLRDQSGNLIDRTAYWHPDAAPPDDLYLPIISGP